MHFHFLGYQIASLHVGNKILRLGKKIPSFGIKISKAWNTKCPCNVYNVLELVDNFGFLISFFFDKFICQVQLGLSWSFLNYIVS